MTANGRSAVIIGGGFAGLAAAYELTRQGVRVEVLEQDQEVGGLAGSFDVGGQRLEKFYHHWFTSDRHVMDLVAELGESDRVVLRPTRTGMYYAQRFFRLSSPADVLRFTPLSLLDRFRLGLMVLRARQVHDWRALESLTASEWIRSIGGENVYRVVWEPLLRGKFGAYADQISAVWFWNKLKLRGGSRGKNQGEVLAYYRGGFAALAERLARAIREAGGIVHTGISVQGFDVREGHVTGVRTSRGLRTADAVIATPALPILADWIEPHYNGGYADRLRRIEYLANVCLVLQLDRSLSDTYWLNVNDPNFPYVGVIEHTNFEPSDSYAGRHIVYLSKYVPENAPFYQMDDRETFDHSLPHIQRMFPRFQRDWVKAYHVWRAQYAQPIVVRRYASLIPDSRTPIRGLHLCTMAQVYPEDRGTSYAIREGRKVGREVAETL